MTAPGTLQPIPQAATVLLLRPGRAAAAGTPEVFTITRSTKLAFSAGVSAFPGGRIDPADELPAALWEGTDLDAWGDLLGLDPAAAGKVLAGAVRETFEETGILVARHRDGTPVDPASVNAWPEDTRIRIERHELDFGDLLTEQELLPDVTGMAPLARWITPEGASRRYDTYFFAAALPEGQVPGTLSFEGTASRWTTAGDALQDFRTGRHQLMPPTWAMFRALAAARSAEEAASTPGEMTAVQPTVGPPPARSVTGFPEADSFADDLAAYRTATHRE
ncbi:NUDIX hydrolase [Citricoccus nitrophenolicus]|uniref:NUDIX hydrolase n=1 Tax=Citricoccus nitrophenolicus TaxID=863575 RepID=A0ABV0IGJ7_9MICC|nr:NUDIX hydrolase [Citricoccus sp. I39-566]WMY79228.1 NUDIX hydrolase [Citricoccus sp. I39-566]